LFFGGVAAAMSSLDMALPINGALTDFMVTLVYYCDLSVFTMFIQAPDEVIGNTELEVAISGKGIFPARLRGIESILSAGRAPVSL
jgi:hypothetical protein